MFNEKIVCGYLYTITNYGYPPKAENTLRYMDEMHRLGFQTIELEGIREKHLSGVYDLKDKIVKKKNELNLDLPYFCVVLPELSSMDPAVRNHQLKLFEKGCEIAKAVGAIGVLDNAPLPNYQFPSDVPIVRHYDEDVLASAFFPKDLKWSTFWDTLTSTYAACCDIAAGYGLTYNMHPAVGVLASTTDAFLYFFNAVKRDNLKFNLDTANQYMMKDNLALSLVRLEDHIDYIHFSDNGGTRVEHIEPGKGTIRWDVFFETLERINFKGHIGVDIGGEESHVHDLDRTYERSVKFIEEHWKNI
jgi:sugar phosphate isomerase/epimerase